MPYYDFFWTDPIIDHLAEHDVTPHDFEHVVRNPARRAKSRSSGHPAAFGFAPDGRYLFCVYEELPDGTLMPVTAYEVNPFGS
jgi:hypothetical protein